ncbi:MAG: hypothetical protein OXR67_13220 [Chloroflexota bacterium]|nr:hypothetical protein [Chloroflexota bacterium]
MTVPVVRKFDAPEPSATGQFTTAVDAETGETFLNLARDNTILDIVNLSAAAVANQVIYLKKNGSQTPIRIYSESISPATAGRVAYGPIELTAGQYQFQVYQSGGTKAAYSFLVKFAHPLSM